MAMRTRSVAQVEYDEITTTGILFPHITPEVDVASPFHHIAGANLGTTIYAGLYTVVKPLTVHRHACYEIAFAVDGHSEPVGPSYSPLPLTGDVWVVLPGCWHAYPQVGDASYLVTLLITHDVIAPHTIIAGDLALLGAATARGAEALAVGSAIVAAPHLHLSAQGQDRARTLLGMLIMELRTGASFTSLGIILQLLGLLDRYGVHATPDCTSVAEDGKPGVQRAMHYIETQYAEPLTLQDVAAHSGYAATYLARKFQQAVGVSPIEYLIQVRLYHAGLLLATTDLPVITIAHAVGFADSQHLARRVRQGWGVTPTQFRHYGRT